MDSEAKTEKVRPIAIASHAFNIVDFNVHFNHLYSICEWSKKHSLVLIGLKGLQAANARNKIVDMAIERDASHILFIDADHYVPTDMLDNLLENKDEAMVSGLVHKKGEGFCQVGWLKNKEGKYIQLNLPLDGRVYEVAVCAFGCTLINLDKLKKLKRPYFRDTCVDLGGEYPDNIRSDINICNMFRDNGEKIWIDTRVLIGHTGINLTVFPQNVEVLKSLTTLNDEALKLKRDQLGSYYDGATG